MPVIMVKNGTKEDQLRIMEAVAKRYPELAGDVCVNRIISSGLAGWPFVHVFSSAASNAHEVAELAELCDEMGIRILPRHGIPQNLPYIVSYGDVTVEWIEAFRATSINRTAYIPSDPRLADGTPAPYAELHYTLQTNISVIAEDKKIIQRVLDVEIYINGCMTFHPRDPG